MSEERYYTQFNSINHTWELWERLPEGEHIRQACFLDGDTQSSPMAEIVLHLFNVVARVGIETLITNMLLAQHRPITPLTQEELEVRLAAYRAQHEAVDET